MDEREWLAERFEANRSHLRAVAYRMLGSLTEADDAVQEAWLRLNRSEHGDIRNLAGLLTTIVGRVCLDMLRLRRVRREQSLEAHPPQSVAGPHQGGDPEQQALLADSLGLALLVVLETLDPAERLAFVLHDMFAVPFDQIAPIVDRTPAAARQLASRARRRVQGADLDLEPDLGRKREVVDAFLAAARRGDFEALLAVLAPDVVARTDARSTVVGAAPVVRGAAAVAGGAVTYAQFAGDSRPAVVGGAHPAVVVTQDGEGLRVMIFTVRDGLITEMEVVTDPDRQRDLDLALLGD